ncbi:MAG: DNA polymerase III subunit beta [Candidatus Kaiserbacteria bacterium]|nr:DNA polymerase III subunit beta [Candidatus Kaiserbacteria bacterium]
MKLKIKTDVLKNITSTLAKVTAKDGLGSVFNGVHVEVAQEKVFLQAQQIGFGVQYVSEVEGAEGGSMFVPIQVLDGVVGSLVDTTTTAALREKKLTVTTHASSSDVYILEEGEKPTIGKPNGSPLFSIRREVLVQGFKDVQHAAAESVVKPEIASVYMYTKDNSIYFVSTDAFRLAESRFLSDDSVDTDFEVIMPIKNVMKVLRILESVSDTMVHLFVQEGVVHFQTDNVLIQTNSVKGSFPDYKNIMPTDFDVTITALRGDVANFLKKARLFADKLNKLSLSVEDEKTIALEFSNEAVGVTKNTIPVVMKGSVDALPSFNYKFVTDALSVITDDRVVLSAVNDKTKPMMIRGAEDTSFTAILSPLLDK